MTAEQRLWSGTRDDLIRAVESLGFPAELGAAIAKHLGSPKAMERMISYLQQVRPKTEELVVDEMLSIRSEIDAWREKKASEEANAGYNELVDGAGVTAELLMKNGFQCIDVKDLLQEMTSLTKQDIS